MRALRSIEFHLFKQVQATLLPLIGVCLLSGCALQTTRIPATSTPTPEYCSWNWAYGPGSTEFDDKVMDSLAAENISALVVSSSYGEIYSCDQTFAPMSLDVKVDVLVDKLGNEQQQIQRADRIKYNLLYNLPYSRISNLGIIQLKIVPLDGNETCYWDFPSQLCNPE